MYIKVTNGVPEPYTIAQFRRDNKNISYPNPIPESFLSEQGVYPYSTDPAPSYDNLTQKLQDSFEVRDGIWYKTFTAVNLSVEQASARVREHRNLMLRETDWRVLPDLNVSQAWLDYRQALRDITTQEGFPYSVIWPEEPTESVSNTEPTDNTSPLTP
jgi:hypothetical protein